MPSSAALFYHPAERRKGVECGRGSTVFGGKAVADRHDDGLAAAGQCATEAIVGFDVAEDESAAMAEHDPGAVVGRLAVRVVDPHRDDAGGAWN